MGVNPAVIAMQCFIPLLSAFIAFYLISTGSWENSNRFFYSLFVEGDELKILKTIPFHKDCRVSVSKMEVVSSLMQSVILQNKALPGLPYHFC
jgi:hypothetical protein